MAAWSISEEQDHAQMDIVHYGAVLAVRPLDLRLAVLTYAQCVFS